MNTDFPAALAHLLANEGGYCDDPKDPGGETNEGVTQHQYDLWRIAHHQPTQDVRNIDPNEVETMYRNWYWNPVLGDQLPAGVDYCVFDCAVNSGPHQAAKFLQRAVGAADDGYIGPATLSAVRYANPVSVIKQFCQERLAFLQSLPGWPHDGHGWSNRVAAVETTAQAMT